jgi:hypothetical protein
MVRGIASKHVLIGHELPEDYILRVQKQNLFILSFCLKQPVKNILSTVTQAISMGSVD